MKKNIFVEAAKNGKLFATSSIEAREMGFKDGKVTAIEFTSLSHTRNYDLKFTLHGEEYCFCVEENEIYNTIKTNTLVLNMYNDYDEPCPIWLTIKD